MRLANRSDIQPLRLFAQALEPAQYYTRQHLKFQAGHYDYHEPLNRLADVLPAESLAVRALDKQVDALIANRANSSAAAAIRAQLHIWHDNNDQLKPLLSASYMLQPLENSAKQVNELSQMGIELVNAYTRNQAFGANDVADMHAKLDAAAQLQDETVIALVRPLEKLLRAFK